MVCPMNSRPPLEIVGELIEEAERPFVSPEVRKAVLHCCDRFRSSLEEWSIEPLTLREAAGEAGYSEDHLGRLVREGKIPNAGRPGAPRILRANLPGFRPALPKGRGASDLTSRRQIVLSVVNS